MAFGAGTVWEVRPSGSDSNAGGFDPGVGSPGTDYSVQDAAQVAYTDIVIDAVTNTKITSAAHPFDATSPGNIINITAGGGFTVQRIEILSVAAGVATCDKAVGTTTSTGGTGNFGGGFLTTGKAMSLAVASNTVYIKNGTYTHTSTANIAAGRINVTVGGASNNIPFHIVGYDTNRTLTNSDANAPVLQAAAGQGGFDVMTFSSNYVRARNLIFNNPNSYSLTNNAVVYMNGVYGLLERVKVDWNSAACFSGIYQGGNENYCRDCYVANTPAHANFTSGGSACTFTNCYATGGTAVGFSGTGIYNRCIAYNNTGGSTDGFNPGSGAGAHYYNCVAYGNGRDGFELYYDTQCFNCISVSNSAWGFRGVSANNAVLAAIFNCATWNNTSGAINTDFASYSKQGNLTLTSDPFTNAAGGDWSLTNTAGGGASCRAAGYPSSFAFLSTNSYGDIGAAQHQDPAAVNFVGSQTTMVWPDTGCIGY